MSAINFTPAIGGENVYSGEVEAVIYQHPAVLEVVVFGIPDAQWGELVAACIVRKTGTDPQHGRSCRALPSKPASSTKMRVL